MILSLFPGLGLLDHAFELEGYCIVRGPDVIWGGDVRQFRPPSGHFEGIVGGPPCQSFSSLANLVRSRGYEPAFGDLIPEFERVVAEAAPVWFLMENVPKAPIPAVAAYAVHNFLLCNSALGEPQIRLRRWSFGVRGAKLVDLRKWIELAALKLPRRAPSVLGDPRSTPVKLGGSGKVKTSFEVGHTLAPTVQGGHGAVQAQTVTGRHPGKTATKGGRFPTYSIEQMLELQGLPTDYLDHCPFTVQGKRKAIGNGVPVAMGRSLARAINNAMNEYKGVHR